LEQQHEPSQQGLQLAALQELRPRDLFAFFVGLGDDGLYVFFGESVADLPSFRKTLPGDTKVSGAN